jgi:predicted transcriptional regulator
MTKKKLEKEIESTKQTLMSILNRLDTSKMVEYREPREHVYSPMFGSYDVQDTFELKDAVKAILEHLGLRLSKTKAVPAKTILEKKNDAPAA